MANNNHLENELNPKTGFVSACLNHYATLCPQESLKKGILSAYSNFYKEVQAYKQIINQREQNINHSLPPEDTNL